MSTIEYNFIRLKNIYEEALRSYDKSVAFDVKIGRGRFLILMFLSEADERDSLFVYMRNTMVMRKLKMYGSHRNGDFKVYISDEVQMRMKAELQLKKENATFDFERFLNEVNNAIPQEITMSQKVKTLRDNRNIIRTVGIDEIEKTVLIGTKVLSKGKPQDRTLRKLYMYTEESETVITEFIKNLKKANMTVAWTTEEQRFKAADINAMINSLK
mgnify:FL=1